MFATLLARPSVIIGIISIVIIAFLGGATFYYKTKANGLENDLKAANNEISRLLTNEKALKAEKELLVANIEVLKQRINESKAIEKKHSDLQKRIYELQKKCKPTTDVISKPGTEPGSVKPPEEIRNELNNLATKPAKPEPGKEALPSRKDNDLGKPEGGLTDEEAKKHIELYNDIVAWFNSN